LKVTGADNTVYAVTANGDGTYTFPMPSQDVTITAEFNRVDTAPPVTSVTVTGMAGVDDWYKSDVTVSLQASDDNSDVASTEYALTVVQSTYGTQPTNGFVPYTSPIVLGNGIYEVKYRSTDQAGNIEDVKSMIVKSDNTAPEFSVHLDKTSIWPANHKMVTINAALVANDATSGVGSVVLTSITSNQPNSDPSDIQGNFGTAATSFSLRAEKSRIYTITYTASDKAGNKTVTFVTVTVPHDQSGKN
jgi:hypothetical protein